MKAGWLIFICACALSSQAAAQISPSDQGILFRSDVAGTRVDPEFERPPPLTMGPIAVALDLAARTTADSNVLRTTGGRSADIYWSLAPDLQLRRTTGIVEVVLTARAELRRYRRFTREDTDTGEIVATAGYDNGNGGGVNARAFILRGVEDRGAAGANVLSAGPPRFTARGIGLTTSGAAGPIAFASGFAFTSRSFARLKQAGKRGLDQSFRDTRTLTASPRLLIPFSPSYAIFVSSSATRTESVKTANPLRRRRDSTGWAILGGVRTGGNGMVIGEAALGWRSQKYRDPRFRDFSGLTYDTTVDWYPTPLLSLRLKAGRDIVNSALPEVAGIDQRTLSLTAYYDPLRDLRVGLTVQQEHDRYRETAFTLESSGVGISTRYLLDRRFSLSVAGRWQSRKTSAGAAALTSNRFVTAIALTAAS